MTAIRKMGNSQGVLIPKPLLNKMGVKTGDIVDVSIERGKLVIAPRKKKLREGWAEDSKAIAAAGDGGLVWPEFAND